MKEKDKDIFEPTRKFNSGIRLYMFQTGTIKTKLKFIKMNHTDEPYEIPVPWFLIGKAFANSPVAAVHALAYPIGGTFHVSHGLSNSLVLPYVLRFNSVDAKATKDYAVLAPYVFPNLNTDRGSQAVSAEFIDRLEELSKRLGLPQKLREVDIPKNACEKMARDAMKQTRLLVNNPREVTEADAFSIYQAAW